eukprot:365990-Chlamydomonas_euryale.AAC.38
MYAKCGTGARFDVADATGGHVAESMWRSTWHLLHVSAASARGRRLAPAQQPRPVRAVLLACPAMHRTSTFMHHLSAAGTCLLPMPWLVWCQVCRRSCLVGDSLTRMATACHSAGSSTRPTACVCRTKSHQTATEAYLVRFDGLCNRTILLANQAGSGRVRVRATGSGSLLRYVDVQRCEQ